MTVENLKKIYIGMGEKYDEAELEKFVAQMNRFSAIRDSLNERLVRDRKQHIQMLSGYRKVNGVDCLWVKFNYLDNEKYWNYITGLMNDYCETFVEDKRTKTTLTLIGA